ncbi:MAG: Ribose 1,5-bisphosphate phosphokinase PhnN [Promethearchaeota archaeon]|jgi:phosphonate metabolism protein PhnN/1,5-bisphosphokinase (PRPP-forming)|nr:MAG: Ribose 1,5-bisphosphate phosphokinase PhnN [Candidatus Lokiarchaeota archaeon]
MKDYPGTLFLVVGNSGSGKDSIISGAMEQYPSNLKKIYTPRRYITRPPSETEENIPVTQKEFNELAKEGKFALKWHIYGLNYGVPIKIDSLLSEGHPIVVNVSRTIIPDARKLYKNLKVIFIRVPLETTIERIKERGREHGKRLEERIERAKLYQDFPDADYIIDNTGSLEDAVQNFLQYIRTHIE